MSKIKVKKSPFTVISNQALQDKSLSYKAIGLFAFMMSLPDSWDYTVAGLVAVSKDGKDSISSGLRELEKAGYLVRNKKRNKLGRWETDYVLQDNPKPQKHQDGLSGTVQPERVIRGGLSGTVNPQQISTNKKVLKKSTNNKQEKESPLGGRARVDKPTFDFVEELVRSNKYTFSASTFWNYYEARDWQLSGRPITNLDKLMAVWQSRENQFPGTADIKKTANPDWLVEYVENIEADWN